MKPDPVRELVERLFRERGISMSAASRAMGRNPAYVHQFLHKHVPQSLGEEDREKLGAFLKVEPEALRSRNGDKFQSPSDKNVTSPLPEGATIRPVPQLEGQDVPQGLQSLIDAYHLLNEQHRKILLDEAKKLVGEEALSKRPFSTDRRA